jgi:hypothetical protein
LVSEIPAGDGKIANLFLQCTEKNSRQNTIITVFWKYLIDFRSEGLAKSFLEKHKWKIVCSAGRTNKPISMLKDLCADLDCEGRLPEVLEEGL